MDMVWHDDSVQHIKPLETSLKSVNTFFYHKSRIVKMQLPIFYVAEKFTPSFSYYGHEITSSYGVVISFQP